jgi:sugar/nucleoside kinase (ribokinase family)
VHDVDVMLIGHFARDILVVDGEATVASGGAVYYGGVALRRLGFSVAIVTRLHPADRVYLDEMSALGIQVYATDACETTGIENVYRSDDMERRVCRPLGFAGPFHRADIPGIRARVCLVVPIVAGEVSLELLSWLSARMPVGLDVQGFVRVPVDGQLAFRRWPEMTQGLGYVTYLKADRAETEHITGETDLDRAARALSEYGPHEVVLTQSSGVTVHAGGAIHRAPFRSRSLEGRTGRGDTCFSTYVGSRLVLPPGEAARVAAAITSLKQERPGPWQGPVADVVSLLPPAPDALLRIGARAWQDGLRQREAHSE